MSIKKVFPQSQIPKRKSIDLLPTVFKTSQNDKFLSGVVDPMIQPGVLEKVAGYIGRRHGKTFNGKDIYLDTDETLRSAYQLEPGVIFSENDKVKKFYDYLDFKNRLPFFGNLTDDDTKITAQQHYSWNPPICWDKFVNFREYYWEPAGPPPLLIFGQSLSVTSTYIVSLGLGSSFIFSPDGFTDNPTITLYRGQTYKFNVNVPEEGFNIKTNYDVGSLLFRPELPYSRNQLVVYADKIWRATKDLLADLNRVISEESSDWELLSSVSNQSPLNYNKGVINNGIENGIIEFTVPFDAPDSLFYQGSINPNRVGRFIIEDINANTKIDIEKEILGKQTYTSSNNIQFTNGLFVQFGGQVIPEKYSRDVWVVEGVGKKITLTNFKNLVVPTLTGDQQLEVLFDNNSFDAEPFDDASRFPKNKDYITIKRNNADGNAWSRYNRWFHRSVLEFAYSKRGQAFPESENNRAKRPIIEFDNNIQLFNHGSVAKQPVDFIDDFTTDAFSNIEGSSSYNIDGEFVFEGARVLLVSDTDQLVNNQIFEIKFITFKNKKQITLVPTQDSKPAVGDSVLVIRGNKNADLMYHYDGSTWKKSQQKTSVNQAPLFDVYDASGVSFANNELYPTSSFSGTKILSYKSGQSVKDSELGFSLAYLNIDNVGDILFEWNWDTDTFLYTLDQTNIVERVYKGFYKNNVENSFMNGWIKHDSSFSQSVLDSIVVDNPTDELSFDTINWRQIDENTLIKFYLNGVLLDDKSSFLPYQRTGKVFNFSSSFVQGDAVVIKIIGNNLSVNTGYYEYPIGLEKNPLNKTLTQFTLGQASDHLGSSLEFENRISTFPLRDIDGYQKYGKQFVKHDTLAPLSVALLCDKNYNIIKSIQHAKKAYYDFKNILLERTIELEFNESIVDFVDEIIADLTKTKTAASTFANSDMLGSGAYTSINYIVKDTGIKVFSLNERFSLEEPST